MIFNYFIFSAKYAKNASLQRKLSTGTRGLTQEGEIMFAEYAEKASFKTINLKLTCTITLARMQ